MKLLCDIVEIGESELARICSFAYAGIHDVADYEVAVRPIVRSLLSI